MWNMREASGKTLNKNTYPKSVGLALNSVGLHAKLGQPIPSVVAMIDRFNLAAQMDLPLITHWLEDWSRHKLPVRKPNIKFIKESCNGKQD